MANRQPARFGSRGRILFLASLLLFVVLLAAGVERTFATPAPAASATAVATLTPEPIVTQRLPAPSLPALRSPFSHLTDAFARAGATVAAATRQNAQPASPLPTPTAIAVVAQVALTPTISLDRNLLPTLTPIPIKAATQIADARPVTDLLVLPLPTSVSQAQSRIPAAATPTLTPAHATGAATIQPTPDGIVRTAHVPILMYHYLSVPPSDADIYRLDLSVSPDRFAAHLDALQGAGYTSISLYDLLQNLTQGTPLPEKPVIITFDDGYRDNYENAFPLLVARGMTATFFVLTDFIDEKRPEYVTWEMAHAMFDAGMSIEAHGRSHTSLKNRDPDYLVWQALGSLEAIEREVGVRPRFISYPAGEYDQATIDLFHSANYWAGVTTIQGATQHNDDLFQLPRVRVRGSTTPEELLRLVALDW